MGFFVVTKLAETTKNFVCFESNSFGGVGEEANKPKEKEKKRPRVEYK